MLCAVRIHVALVVFGFVGLAQNVSAQSWPYVVGANTDAPTPPLGEPSYLAATNAPALPSAPRHYVPPAGFADHRWGEPRSTFASLPAEPEVVLVTWTRGMQRPFEDTCSGRCTVNEYLRLPMPRLYDGDGFHVLSEYMIESQGFKLPETGVVLHPIVYQFCANWSSVRRRVPKNFDELNKFCGMRMLFETETRAQLRRLPEDHVTRFDLVLAELISRYGKPANFSWRGRVTVEPVDGPAVNSPGADRKFSTWRWCPAPRDGLMTRCESSIVLSIDPDLGRGIVLFSTSAVWKYAWARETSDMGPDPLYTLLHALSLKNRTNYAQRVAQWRKAAREEEQRGNPAIPTGADAPTSDEKSPE